MVITGNIPTVNTPTNPVQDDNDNEEDAGDSEDGWEIGIEGTAWAGAEELSAGQIFVKEVFWGI